jgi:hypothetical protein
LRLAYRNLVKAQNGRAAVNTTGESHCVSQMLGQEHPESNGVARRPERNPDDDDPPTAPTGSYGPLMDFPAVPAPDADAEQAARSRQDSLTKPRGALGRLEELSIWVSACQGTCPPEQFTRARIVVFAGDHGVAKSGVSAYPPEVTAQMVANIDAGGAAVNVLAGNAGATVRVVDVAVDCYEPWS